MMLESENIYLRAMEPEDLDFLYRCENDAAEWENGCTRNPLSRHTLRQYMQNSHSDVYEDMELRLMIQHKASAKPIGCIDLYNFDLHNQKAGVAIILQPDYRKCGYAAEAVNLLCDYAFNFLKINQLYAYVTQKNRASIALFLRCGFENTATLKRWVKTLDGYTDVLTFQRFGS